MPRKRGIPVGSCFAVHCQRSRWSYTDSTGFRALWPRSRQPGGT